MATLGLIYALALFFWFRYLYIRSFRNAERRESFADSLQRIIPFIPPGLHAIFLFCYAVFQFRPVQINISRFFAQYVLHKKDIEQPDLFPLKVLFTASLVTALYYVLLRLIRHVHDRASAIFLHLVFFTAGLYSLKVLVLTIKWSAGLSGQPDLPMNFGSTYGCIFSLLFTFFLLIMRGADIRTDSGFRYFALTARLLGLYCFIVLLFSLPRIIFFALGVS